MGSRILPRTNVEGAEPINWSTWGDSPQASQQGSSRPESERHAAGSEPERVSALEQRLREAQMEMPRREEQARSAGFREGEQAGARAAAAEFNAVMARMARAIEELAGLRRRFRSEAEKDIIKLTLAIAKRVLHREISIDAGALLGLVRVALEQIDVRELHRVRLHPVDAPAIERQLASAGVPDRVQVIADPALERGAAIFETSRGNLDASVATQLAEIERGFGDLLEKQR